jgi:hypothetical protein
MESYVWEVGFVTFLDKEQKRPPVQKWLLSLFPFKLYTINNYQGGCIDSEIQGHNQLQDLGAYLSLCEQFTGDGPYLLINDTLFTNHISWAWKYYVKLWQKYNSNLLEINSVWGDIRKPNNPPQEIPSHYLASWIFIIPNKTVLTTFSSQLSSAIHDSAKNPMSVSYQSYLTNFLNGNVFRGWHKIVEKTKKDQKMECYIVEHKLNRLLLESNIQLHSLQEVKPILGLFIRTIERIFTRTIFIKNYLQYFLQNK